MLRGVNAVDFDIQPDLVIFVIQFVKLEVSTILTGDGHSTIAANLQRDSSSHVDIPVSKPT